MTNDDKGLGTETGVMGVKDEVVPVCAEDQYDVPVSLRKTSFAVPISGFIQLSKSTSMPAGVKSKFNFVLYD